MKSYLMSLRFDVWHSIVSGYTNPKTPPIDIDGKNPYHHNAKAMNAILSGLLEKELFKVM